MKHEKNGALVVWGCRIGGQEVTGVGQTQEEALGGVIPEDNVEWKCHLHLLWECYLIILQTQLFPYPKYNRVSGLLFHTTVKFLNNLGTVVV